MTNAVRAMTDEEALRELGELNRQRDELEKTRIRAEAEASHKEQEERAALAEAREKFGTDDLDALRAIVQERRRTNTEKVLDFKAHLEEVTAALAAAQAAPAA